MSITSQEEVERAQEGFGCGGLSVGGMGGTHREGGLGPGRGQSCQVHAWSCGRAQTQAYRAEPAWVEGDGVGVLRSRRGRIWGERCEDVRSKIIVKTEFRSVLVPREAWEAASGPTACSGGVGSALGGPLVVDGPSVGAQLTQRQASWRFLLAPTLANLPTWAPAKSSPGPSPSTEPTLLPMGTTPHPTECGLCPCPGPVGGQL